MHATAPTLPIRSGKRRLLESCAITAGLMALAFGGPALAQGVAGTGNVVGGSAVFSPPAPGTGGPNTTQVEVGGAQTIINWTPSDTAPTGGAIDFLPAGNSLEFYGPGQYTVLNRFVDGAGGSIGRQVALNGTVNSYVGTRFATGGNTQGGNIWFYNAGGILIGGSAVINVGSLLLTANDIDTSGGLFGPSNTIRFRGATSTSAVNIAQGASINASNGNPGGSYVALVAPRVVQAGAVRVDGSAAYVAAEQADIRINSGLFDINVTVGAEGGNVITHTGTTTGPAHQDGDTDQSRIYMVAIPKNDAVTMLVSGAIGYDDAVSATEADGAVRLSAGYNITNGEIDAAPANGIAANITVNDTLFRSSTVAHASGAFVGQALQQLPSSPPPLSSAGQIFVEGSGTFIGDASATLSIGTGQLGGATGTLTVQSGGANGAAGNAAVNVTGGTLSAPGALTIQASGIPQALTGDSQGGTASLTITGGSVTTSGVTVEANGIAAVGTNGNGGSGRGGNASITVSNSGSTLTAGNIFINAVGSGASFFASSPPAINGNGTGGTASLTVSNGGSVSGSAGPTALLSLDASGVGGLGLTQSGNGTGGTARIQLSGPGSFLSTTQSFLLADGNGGENISGFLTQNGGDGTGGTAEILINADAASTVSLGTTAAYAIGRGGSARAGENASGGDAVGGTARLTVDGGINAQFGQITLDASAEAGTGRSPSGTSATSGNADAGAATLTATNGSTVNSSADIRLFAVGMGIGGENFGTGTGGDVTATATAGGTISAANQIFVQAMGGGLGSAMAQSAGSGTGGNVDFIADGGTISAETYNVDARGQIVNVRGNNGGAQGGTIDLLASNGGQIRATLDATNILDASAEAGISAGGSLATGGSIRLIADGGSIDLSGTTNLIAGGITGGASGSAAGNVTGTGGTILVQLLPNASTASAISFSSLGANTNGRTLPTVDAPGGALNGIGNGQGGTLTFDIQGGTLSSGVVNLTANGTGARGNGQGGTATFTQTGGTVNVSDLKINADGFGGVAAGQSGSGTGGTATVNLLGGTLNAAEIIATADGEGRAGNSGDDSDPLNLVLAGRGGNGQGGIATIRIDGTNVDSGTMQANARGTGGAGGTFFTSSGSTSPGVPGNGGNGTGGTATINIVSGTVTGTSITADALGMGGVGGDSSTSSGTSTGTGVGGAGGNGQGGTATIRLATAVTASGTLSSVARGVGGHGDGHDNGGNGGNGIGGLAQAIIDNFDAGTLAVTIDASARGGDGANGRNGSGGNGGNAIGGTARALADGANARVTVAQTNFITVGTGGNGGNGARSFLSAPGVRPAGGMGGNGQGGTLEVGAGNGAAVALIPITSGAISLSSTGIGGNGGDGADYNVAGQTGGDGGNAGAGRGGSVALRANGGTITSNGNDIDIQVSGFSGAGGLGGDGAAGPGAAGNTATTTGGLAVIEALAGPGGAGQISLGGTNISASGDNAGRILLRSGGNITMANLTATANGAAPPTNNDTDAAPTGIFLAATGGTIATIANMSLITDSSIGVYAQGAGTVRAGTGLSLNAADQIDIRHDLRSGTAPTIQSGDELTATAGTSITAAPGSLIGSGSTLLLAANGPNGTISVDRLAAASIALNSSGAARVEHAEASSNFTVQAASFQTGPNSIITGGDIDITSPGAVDLGNSSAGGFVQVTGQSIAFNSIGAGSTVGLNATGTAAGAEGISGGSITAGGNINLSGNSIAITGPVQGTGSLFAFTSGGNLGIALADVDGNIGINASGNLTGSYAAGGNVTLTAGGDIVAQANAAGGYTDPNGITAEGTVFADADGNATLTNSSAATMLGVRAGQAASVSNATAGEDVLVLAGTTATLANVTAGDDLTATAAGGITANGLTTTGAGSDNRTLFYGPASSSGFNSFQITTSAADLSNIVLTASAGNIGGGNMNAFDNLTLTASGAVAVTAPATARRDISITAASVNVANLANSGGVVDGLDAGRNLQVTASGAITGGAMRAGGNLALTAGTTIAIARAATGAGGSLALDGAGGVNAGIVAGGGATSLNSSGGAVSVNSLASTGAVNANGQSILIAGGTGNLVFSQINASAGDAVITNSGDISVTSGLATGRAALTSANGAVNVTQLSANSIDLAAGTDMTLGTVTAAQGLTAQAGNILTLAGVVTGRDMALTSGDIAIGANGRAGTAGTTQTLQLANGNSGRPTFVGGTGTRSGYHIDAGEMTRLNGTAIRISGPAVANSAGVPGGPDLIIDSFTMTGGGSGSNLGANGSLTIATAGSARVIGNALLTGLADANTLNLTAADRLEVLMGQGSVRLTGANNAPGGQLNLMADDVIVATLAAIADIDAATTTDAIETRLAQNDGVTSDEGALFARGINADVDGGFYVQNSGTGTAFAERRGLTFGAGGLNVVTDGPARIVINGVHLGPAGQVTGLDAVALLTVGGAPVSGPSNRFDPRSRFNGCLIAASGACTFLARGIESSFPVQDVIDNQADPDTEESEANSLPTPLITMRDIDALTGEPLLDDPVTGAGNDDLWTPPTE